MSNTHNLAGVVPVAAETEVVDFHAKTDLGDGVEIKVADSNKCISIYGITGRMPVNFTREQADLFFSKLESILEYYKQAQEKLLSREERKYQAVVSKTEAKILKQSAELAQKQRAIALMKQNPGMDWNSALELAKQ